MEPSGATVANLIINVLSAQYVLLFKKKMPRTNMTKQYNDLKKTNLYLFMYDNPVKKII